MFCTFLSDHQTGTEVLGSSILAPVAETGFSHRLTAYKIVGHFFGLSYLNVSGDNQVEKSFFGISNIPVPCPHAQLRGRTVIQKLWTFFGPRGRDRSQSPPCWIFRVKQTHQPTASEGTTRLAQSLSIRTEKNVNWDSHLTVKGTGPG